MIDRRAFLLGASALALAPRDALAVEPPPACWVEPVPEKLVRPERAASMVRMLSDGAAGGRPRVGMTRLDGFVRDGSDVVLWGRVEPKRPELEFDDIVVAMRAISGAYGTAPPAISLDTKIGHTERYRKLDAVNPTSQAEFDAKHRALAAQCADGVGVPRVTSLPRDARVTKLLLVADWTMKQVVCGAIKLRIKKPFQDVDSAMVEYDKSNIPNGVRSPRIGGRFWFEPGKMSYVVDGRSAFLDTVQVVLRDEAQDATTLRVTAGGYETFSAAGGVVSPFMRAFACAWTNSMDEVVRTGEPWSEMNDIFRHFALARAMRATGATASLDKSLLESYVVESVEVPSHFPGIYDLRRFETIKDGKKARFSYNFCGGVDLTGTVTRSPAIGPDVHLAGRMVIESMRSCTESCWNVQ